MTSRRNAPLSSLTLVLPHPPLPRRGPASATTPQTPRSSSSMSTPSLFKLETSGPRRSTDSWNSSTCDGGDDDMEWEWTAEQVSLLGKTLDALPSHLLSPYNGSIPPANVLDKIARSVINAKDPIEWPHSVRSTRIKLLNLARSYNDNGHGDGRRSSELSPDVLQPTTTNVPKKPLYRQSSMDFLKGNSLMHERSIDRLSTRLQRVDRIVSPKLNPYEDLSPRSPSPLKPYGVLNGEDGPRTPIEDGPRFPLSRPPLQRGPRLRRSTTTIACLPTIPSEVAAAYTSTDASRLTVPKVKRSESFSSPSFNGLGHSLKRAPSFGTLSTRSTRSTKSHDSSRMSVDDQKENSPHIHQELDIYPSSDEEEKHRHKKVKKLKTSVEASPTIDKGRRTRSGSRATLPKAASSATLKSTSTATPTSTVRSKKSSRAKMPKASVLFGAELPHPQPEPSPPATLMSPAAPVFLESLMTPAPNNRTLRRVKTTNFPSQMSRRISFSNLIPPVEEETTGQGSGLGSAFQMS
ncbi:hypothetical protein SCHPADRAFT_916825 [Schizopora paradoxa]|uniref:Uncharacterized protein n=1 Tax=Schizopora paradoxa TaxID=27342 RepID=A0A0H2RAT9_9AGAM|nr:hypothetical protein SCHPADRAFT_916825 [Schizopora paradoxa]